MYKTASKRGWTFETTLSNVPRIVVGNGNGRGSSKADSFHRGLIETLFYFFLAKSGKAITI